MKPEISIIVPGIRNYNWEKLLSSVTTSTDRSFEIIFCGPYSPEAPIASNPALKYVADWGNPVRASQIAASLAEGKLIVWASDDGVFIPYSLDKAVDALYDMGNSWSNVVVTKYLEGREGTVKEIQNEKYYTLKHCFSNCQWIPKNWYLFNTGVMYRGYFEHLGGWDAEFEGTFVSHCDLAMRAQGLGASVKFLDVQLLDCDHTPGTSGDHGPIHHAQLTHDVPLFESRYHRPLDGVSKLIIPFDNWKLAHRLWTRRFG